MLQAEQDAPDFSLAGGWERLPELQQQAEWWQGWFDEWTPWVVARAARAEAAGVEAFAPYVWMNFAVPADVYPQYFERWVELVRAIREVYSGELVGTLLVSADERFEPLIELFDIVIVTYDAGGIAESPLIADPLDPTVSELRAAFEELTGSAREHLAAADIAVHFAIGASSNSGQRASEEQSVRERFVVDFQEQAAYYEAFFDVIDTMPWVSGVWIERMDWFDQFARPAEGWYYDATTEASPRSKPAEDVIQRRFQP